MFADFAANLMSWSFGLDLVKALKGSYTNRAHLIGADHDSQTRLINDAEVFHIIERLHS